MCRYESPVKHAKFVKWLNMPLFHEHVARKPFRQLVWNGTVSRSLIDVDLVKTAHKLSSGGGSSFLLQDRHPYLKLPIRLRHAQQSLKSCGLAAALRVVDPKRRNDGLSSGFRRNIGRVGYVSRVQKRDAVCYPMLHRYANLRQHGTGQHIS